MNVPAYSIVWVCVFFLVFFVFGFGSGPVQECFCIHVYIHMYVLLNLLSVSCVGCVCCVVVPGSGMDV